MDPRFLGEVVASGFGIFGRGLIDEHHAHSPGALHRNISGCAIALPRAKEVQCQVCDTDPV
jgi:hypothetical protein